METTMPEVGTLTDEALMTWIVSALVEAQRRGLTTVMLGEPREADDSPDDRAEPELSLAALEPTRIH